MFWLVFLCCLFSDISSVAPCKCLHSRRQDSLEGKEIQEGADVFAPIASLPFIFSDTTISASGYQPVFGAVRCSGSFVKERCISQQSTCNFQRPFFNGLRGNEGDVLLPNYNLLQSAGLQTKYFLASYLLSCCQSQGKASSQGIKVHQLLLHLSPSPKVWLFPPASAGVWSSLPPPRTICQPPFSCQDFCVLFGTPQTCRTAVCAAGPDVAGHLCCRVALHLGWRVWYWAPEWIFMSVYLMCHCCQIYCFCVLSVFALILYFFCSPKEL